MLFYVFSSSENNAKRPWKLEVYRNNKLRVVAHFKRSVQIKIQEATGSPLSMQNTVIIQAALIF